MTRDEKERMLRDALLRSRIKEIVELAEANPLYGISREAALHTLRFSYISLPPLKKGLPSRILRTLPCEPAVRRLTFARVSPEGFAGPRLARVARQSALFRSKEDSQCPFLARPDLWSSPFSL